MIDRERGERERERERRGRGLVEKGLFSNVRFLIKLR